MTAEVHKLPTEAEDRRSVPPVNFTITHALPGGRQITAATTYWPKPGQNPNALIDHINEAMDRQRARYEIGIHDDEEDTINAQILLHKEQLDQAEADITRLDAETDEKINALRAKSLEAAKKYEALFSRLKTDAPEGREFDPSKPGNRQQLQPHIVEQAKAREEVEKLIETRAIGHKNHEANMAMFKAKLAKFEEKKAARLKFLGQ